jgi:pimeloyl-ACP methyl ester carboxylesterase
VSGKIFVLVHGAWHDSSCWNAVSNLLRGQNHVVISPDLPGHGSHKSALGRITFKSYVKSLLDLLDAMATQTILVGHSMSGMVISEVASKIPQKISHLIYVSAYLPRHNESIFDLISLNRSHEPFTAIEHAMLMSPDKRTCSIEKTCIIPLFYNLTPTPLACQAQAAFGLQPTLPLATKVELDEMALSTIPATYISCSKDKVIPLHHQRRMLARRPCSTLLQIDADHSPFYSAPVQLAALLDASASEP